MKTIKYLAVVTTLVSGLQNVYADSAGQSIIAVINQTDSPIYAQIKISDDSAISNTHPNNNGIYQIEAGQEFKRKISVDEADKTQVSTTVYILKHNHVRHGLKKYQQIASEHILLEEESGMIHYEVTGNSCNKEYFSCNSKNSQAPHVYSFIISRSN